MKEVVKYLAADGQEFATKAECLAHEKENALHIVLAARTEAELLAGLNRTDLALADALEAAGDKVKELRLAAGDLRRQRKKAGAPEVGQAGAENATGAHGAQDESAGAQASAEAA